MDRGTWRAAYSPPGHKELDMTDLRPALLPLPRQAEELIGPQHSLQPPAAVCLGPPSPRSMLSTRPSVATVGKRGTRRPGKRWGGPQDLGGHP